ncbi:MAG: LptA/OstA family protein [Pseudomonadota bacterium]
MSTWRPVLAALILTSLLTPPASAQVASFGDEDQPLEILADQGIEWRRDERLYIARGNAVATQGDVSVRADLLRARYSGAGDSGDITQIEAVGNVRITSPDAQVFGQRGTYDVPRDVMRMTGEGLRLESAEDVVTAEDSLEYRPSERLAIARGRAQVERFDRAAGTSNLLRADVLEATFAEGGQALEVVDATDNVEVLTPCEYVAADRGRYLVAEQLATMEGNVRITRGSNQLNGEQAVVNLETGISRLTGGRVSGLLVPDSRTEATNDECR